MSQPFETVCIDPALLRQTIEKAASQGGRLVEIHACHWNGQYRIFYTIAHEYRLTHYEMVVHNDAPVESIASIYPCAKLYEQEMTELFGVNIINMPKDPHVKLYHLKDHPMKTEGERI